MGPSAAWHFGLLAGLSALALHGYTAGEQTLRDAPASAALVQPVAGGFGRKLTREQVTESHRAAWR